MREMCGSWICVSYAITILVLLGKKGTSHRRYRTTWAGDPRVNVQNDKGKAKVYQVKQVLRAIELLEVKE